MASTDQERTDPLRSESHGRPMSRRTFLRWLSLAGSSALVTRYGQVALAGPAAPTAGSLAQDAAARKKIYLPFLGRPHPAREVSYRHLPRWRGFNLLEKFDRDTDWANTVYQEWDLDFMARWGFDFVRLPTDYRIWTTAPGQYREDPLKDIDQVIAWARARSIHVLLCLHRAPGYCCNDPPEALDLWGTDAGSEEARRQFADQWRMLAQRYRGIPSSELTFNLVNEPPTITAEQYVRAATPAVNAIRQADPSRVILADGAWWGRNPVPELIPLQVAQSTHCYDPMCVTHYRAPWIYGSDQWPAPAWPVQVWVNRYLAGPWQPSFHSPFVLQGPFAAGATLTLHVQTVSSRAELVMRANGATIFDKWFLPGPGQGEWKESTYRPEWDDYEALYDEDYSATLPAGTTRLELEVIDGDWLTFSQISLRPFPGAPGNEVVIQPYDTEWGVAQRPLQIDASGNLTSPDGRGAMNRQTLWNDRVLPWTSFRDQQGIGVHIGEFGVHNLTPHNVALAWMSDCLQNWKQAGLGWALWNLRGSFGQLDSWRTDVSYENDEGHSLDRQMLELLRQG